MGTSVDTSASRSFSINFYLLLFSLEIVCFVCFPDRAVSGWSNLYLLSVIRFLLHSFESQALHAPFPFPFYLFLDYAFFTLVIFYPLSVVIQLSHHSFTPLVPLPFHLSTVSTTVPLLIFLHRPLHASPSITPHLLSPIYHAFFLALTSELQQVKNLILLNLPPSDACLSTYTPLPFPSFLVLSFLLFTSLFMQKPRGKGKGPGAV